MQSSSIVVQGMAAGTIDLQGLAGKLFKEFLVAVVNGLILSGLIFAYNILFSESFKLTITVSLALFAVILLLHYSGLLYPCA